MPKIKADKLGEIPQGTGGGGGNYIRSIYLRNDGEECRLAFLSDQLFYGYFHTVEREDGSFGGWWVCLKEESGQDCEICERDMLRVEDGLKRRNWPRLMFLVWAYELTHFYTKKPEQLDYEVVSRASRELYSVPVGAVRLMRYSAGHLRTSGIQRQVDLHGTLMGRWFNWVRRGEGLNTSYLLELHGEIDTKPMDQLTKLAESLPDLEDVAFGVVESLSDDDAPQRRNEPEEVGEGFDKMVASLEESEEEPW